MKLCAYLFVTLLNLWYSIQTISLHNKRTRNVGREGQKAKTVKSFVIFFFELGGIETQDKSIITRQNPIVYQ